MDASPTLQNSEGLLARIVEKGGDQIKVECEKIIHERGGCRVSFFLLIFSSGVHGGLL